MSADDPTRQRILDAAVEHLADVGLLSFSVRRVAQAAGVGVATVSHHFDNRGALIQAVLKTANDELDELAEAVRTSFWNGPPTRETLEDILRRGVRFARTHDAPIRAQAVLAVHDGRLPGGRSRDERKTVRMLGDALAAAYGIERLSARMVVRSVIFLVTRYALLSPPELEEVCGTSVPAEQEQAIVRHLSTMTREMLSLRDR
ncbi:MAG: helix-turn-helix domain-containing protein [Myxococcota bacterium]